jgi:outer membrane protein OmpA-like peptidoglycan-associated protein
MRSTLTSIAILLVVTTLTACAPMRQDPYCKWGLPVWGALMGGAAGGLGVGLGDSDASDGAIAGAAVGGTVAGGLLGWLVGHYVCEEPRPAAPFAAPPPPPPARKHIELSADTYFDFDKSTLKPAGKEKIDAEIIPPMKAHPQLHALVEGYTDSIGSDAYNLRLSERRANAVRDYMVAQGIAASRITTKGWGKAKPVADNRTKEGRAKNRRVEITEE